VASARGCSDRRPERPVARFPQLADDERFTTDSRQLVALSPDGRQIAWAGIGGRLLLRSVAEFGAHAVPGTENLKGVAINNPVFSPDGGSLAFYSSEDRTIRRILSAADAGAVQRERRGVRLSGTSAASS
jgi:hypothetical protein